MSHVVRECGVCALQPLVSNTEGRVWTRAAAPLALDVVQYLCKNGGPRIDAKKWQLSLRTKLSRGSTQPLF